MDNDALTTMTKFDSILQNRHLQMIKAAIPYLSKDSQKIFSILTKYMELIKTVELSYDDNSALSMCSIDEENQNTKSLSLLQEIRPFCDSKEIETVDMFIDILQMYATYESLLQ